MNERTNPTTGGSWRRVDGKLIREDAAPDEVNAAELPQATTSADAQKSTAPKPTPRPPAKRAQKP